MTMKKLATLGMVVGLLMAAPVLYADKWDFDYSGDWDVADTIGTLVVVNPCADPPQILEDWTGTNHSVQKVKFQTDDEGNYIGFEGHIHTNHQGVKCVGYDLELDADGKVVVEDGRPKKAVDADGNFIATDYSIPGTFNYGQQLNDSRKEGDKWENHETFMCMMISHGGDGNGMIHYNGHLTVTEEGGIEMYQDNFWCKCAGAGPDKNGRVDCDEFGEFCQQPVLPGGPY